MVFEPYNIKLVSGSNILIISMLACDALIVSAIVVTFVDSEVGLSGQCMKNNGLIVVEASFWRISQ